MRVRPIVMSSHRNARETTFEIRYLDWTPEQERQWLRDVSVLCLQVYEEGKSTHTTDA